MTRQFSNDRNVQDVWNRLPGWAKTALYAIDRSLNAKFGGDPNQTISERLARDKAAGGWRGQIGCAILDRYDKGHCDRIQIKGL